MEGQLLAQKAIYLYTVSQIMEVDNLTGRFITDENRTLLADLAPFPLLQHKLRLLIQVLKRPNLYKFVGLATTCFKFSTEPFGL
jgi:hypothetical protein